jgi:hypothetical protein
MRGKASRIDCSDALFYVIAKSAMIGDLVSAPHRL